MFGLQPYMTPSVTSASGDAERRTSLPIPTIYEHIPVKAPQWEYYVLTIQPEEESLPEAERLTKLGQQGWILVGLLDERASGRGVHVHYYFARQKEDE